MVTKIAPLIPFSFLFANGCVVMLSCGGVETAGKLLKAGALHENPLDQLHE